METAEILERLDDLADGGEPLLKADGLDEAIIGLAHGWFESSQHAVVAYDYDKCIEIFMDQGMSIDDAEEWMSFNVMGAFVGPYTPVFIYKWRD